MVGLEEKETFIKGRSFFLSKIRGGTEKEKRNYVLLQVKVLWPLNSGRPLAKGPQPVFAGKGKRAEDRSRGRKG